MTGEDRVILLAVGNLRLRELRDFIDAQAETILSLVTIVYVLALHFSLLPTKVREHALQMLVKGIAKRSWKPFKGLRPKQPSRPGDIIGWAFGPWESED